MNEGGPGHWIGVWTLGFLLFAASIVLWYWSFWWAHEQFMR